MQGLQHHHLVWVLAGSAVAAVAQWIGLFHV
jgi:hypothetical protein